MPETTQPGNQVKLFCSYAHEDEGLEKQFLAALGFLRQSGLIEFWHDREIRPGQRWAVEIDEHLNTADIVVLLVSQDFLNSDFCYTKELKRALEREASKEAVILPVIVRACDWEESAFGHLQGIPSGVKAVTSWENRDEAWTSVAKSLKVVVREVLERKRQKLEIENDQAEARRIYTQILSDVQQNKERMERLRLMTLMRIQIHALTQDLESGEKTPDKSFNNMDAYIRG